MSGIILGIDAGNHMAKVAGLYGAMQNKTALCDWFPRDIKEVHGDDDMEFEIDGRKGFSGSIAENEDQYGGGGSLYGDTKAHEDVKIRVLLAAHRYLKKHAPYNYEINIVTGQPLSTHNDAEKQKIKNMLTGRHIFAVNGEQQIIHIQGCTVAAEGGGAFWCVPQMGTVRTLDIGSGTVNAVTIKDKRIINNASGTFNFGAETVLDKNDLKGMARGIIRNTMKLKWGRSDKVLICGGIANEMLPYLLQHYPNAEIIQPQLQHSGGMSILHPVYGNAVGFLEIAKGVYI